MVRHLMNHFPPCILILTINNAHLKYTSEGRKGGWHRAMDKYVLNGETFDESFPPLYSYFDHQQYTMIVNCSSLILTNIFVFSLCNGLFETGMQGKARLFYFCPIKLIWHLGRTTGF